MRTTEHAIDLATSSRKPAASRLAGLTRLVSMVYRTFRNRIELDRLSELDEHQLQDIGLKREDVREAITSPFFSDTAAHLTQASRRRIGTYYKDVRGL